MASSARRDVRPPVGVGFLLVQLGYYAARSLAQHLAPLGIDPRHYGVLRGVEALEGSTQQAVGERLGLAAPRMVALVDDLERAGMVERRRNPADRRAYGLYMTAHGRACLRRATRAVEQREEELLDGLDTDERSALEALLRHVTESVGIGGAVMPGVPYKERDVR